MAQRRIKRAHPTYLGVYQRCVDQCPEPCDAHTWTWHAQAPSDERRGAQFGRGGYPSAELASVARSGYLESLGGQRAVRWRRTAHHLTGAGVEMVSDGLNKTCTGCHQIKPCAAFSPRSGTRDGLKAHCRRCSTAKQRARYRTLRNTALAVLGGICRCCGQDRLAFLQIDHITGDGGAHRRELMAASGGRFVTEALHRWVVDNPEEARARCQVLCANCHQGKTTEDHHSCPPAPTA